MSEAITSGDGEDEIVAVNFKVTQSFLDEIDETWQGRGFNSRGEFIRYTLCDATEFPTFDRDELAAPPQSRSRRPRRQHDECRRGSGAVRHDANEC